MTSEIDPVRLVEFIQKRKLDNVNHEPEVPVKKRRKKRKGRRIKVKYDTSFWWTQYVVSDAAEHDLVEASVFRRRFRLPRTAARSLWEEAIEKNWFPGFGKPNALGEVYAPIPLLILGVLRYN